MTNETKFDPSTLAVPSTVEVGVVVEADEKIAEPVKQEPQIIENNTKNIVDEERVPAHWAILPCDQGIEARHTLTARRFTGSVQAFNETFLR